VQLNAGEKKRITFTLHGSDCAYFDECTVAWKTGKGPCRILIGSSSRDIRLKSSLSW
jgi:hypothetical protein